MRKDEGIVTYLAGDHLGSVSLAVRASDGAVLAQSRYTPFGVERWNSGNNALTAYGFTGQREDSYIKLLDFGARWYDPVLGRFISADTIIPDPGNPADWDRYSYVRNNPLKYNDPSGHAVNDDSQGSGCSTADKCIQAQIKHKNDQIIRQIKSGKIPTDLEGFAQLLEYAAAYTPSSSERFIQNVASVLTGDTKTLAWVDEIMGQIDKSNRDTNYNPANQLGQSGFAPIFRDPGLGGNQPHHFWFYVQMGFQQSKLKNAPSAIFPYLAVIGHETLLTKSQAGNSFQDLALGFEGVNLGADLWAGAISPSYVGNYVRENFNPLSQTAVNWSCHAETFFSFLWALGY